MSGFKDMVERDNRNIFMNADEFADRRTVIYDEQRYVDIPVILSGLKEQDRRQLVSDHVQGLYLVSTVLHCNAADMNGKLPEKGSTIKIDNTEGGGGFFHSFKVASSVCEMGMFRVELEAMDE